MDTTGNDAFEDLQFERLLQSVATDTLDEDDNGSETEDHISQEGSEVDTQTEQSDEDGNEEETDNERMDVDESLPIVLLEPFPPLPTAQRGQLVRGRRGSRPSTPGRMVHGRRGQRYPLRGRRGRPAYGRGPRQRGGRRECRRRRSPPPQLGSFLSRDKTTQWQYHDESIANPPRLRLRQGVPSNDARRARSIRQAWNIFLTREILDLIVVATNQKMEENRQGLRRQSEENRQDATYDNITETELRAFIGVLYMAGIHRNSHINMEDLYVQDSTGIEFFRLVMSLQRFRFIMRSIRFDDSNSRVERKHVDKLAYIREVFDIFTRNCITNYEPSDFMTVDEMLIAFRGNCPFRQYIPRKPAKFGIKIHAACDVKTHYTFNMEVYVGLQPEGNFQVSNSAEDVVLRLVQPLFNRPGHPRVITTDNWYSSLSLLRTLRANNLEFIGTVRKTRRFVPQDFTTNSRPQYSTLFGFRDGETLLSYKPKKRKHVLLLTSVKEVLKDLISPLDSKQKPEAILLYNKTKGGVDTVDKLISSYSVNRGSSRWPVVIGSTILNIAAINANVIFQRNNPSTRITRRRFIKELAYDLVYDHVRQRRNVQQTYVDVKQRIDEVFPKREHDPESEEEETHEGKCYLCPPKSNRKTKTHCVLCRRPICKKTHTVALCERCYERKCIN